MKFSLVMKKMNTKNPIQKYILFSLVTLFSIACLYNINYSPLNDWDESRHIVSALQMIGSGNFIVNWWDSSPDMWNLKPPVSFLSIVGFSKLFGNSLLTLRMASISSGIVLVSLCSYIAVKRYGYLSAIAFMLLVLSCHNIITSHGFRTADPDSVYLLFAISSVIVLSIGYNVKNISLAALLISFSFLTKSWHALSFGFVFILSYAYMFRSNGFKIKSILIPMLCFFSPIMIWLSIRYQYDGFVFLQQMIDYDLLHRSSSQIEGHYSSPWFYIKELFHSFLLVMIAFISSLIISLVTNGFKKTFSYDIIVLITSISTLIILFTLSGTRLPWYGYPHTLLICFTSAALFSKSKKSWIIITFILLPSSLIQVNKTIKEVSHYVIPDFYNQLSIINNEDNLNIYIPSSISQSERAAIMIYGDFTQNQIKYNGSDNEYYLFYRNSSEDNQSSSGCRIISSSKNINIYRCKK